VKVTRVLGVTCLFLAMTTLLLGYAVRDLTRQVANLDARVGQLEQDYD
jgi:hypothetical protein